MSVVVCTYEWPEALEGVLRSLAEQGSDDFEIVVADDGSGPETRAVVERWRARLAGRVAHAWQPDHGYRRARVLNLGALTATGDYLLFLDGDCLVRHGFVEAIRRGSLTGFFLAGKRLNLSAGLSRRVLGETLPVWRWSAARWLLRAPRELIAAPRESARPGLLIPLRDRRRPWRAEQPEFFPPYNGYGSPFGVSREDFEQVNGFDMRFVGWGYEDVDMAVRLRRLGRRCGWAGPRTTLLHLWHEAKKGAGPSNAPLLAETRASARVLAVEGLRELAAEVNRAAGESRAAEECP